MVWHSRVTSFAGQVTRLPSSLPSLSVVVFVGASLWVMDNAKEVVDLDGWNVHGRYIHGLNVYSGDAHDGEVHVLAMKWCRESDSEKEKGMEVRIENEKENGK